MSFEIALQAAIYETLTSTDTTSLSADFVDQEYSVNGASIGGGRYDLAALVVGVYDDVPQAADSGNASKFPYVTIGESVHTDWSNDTNNGDDATVTIHSWSRYAGRKEIKQIQGAVYDILHRSGLSIAGYATVGVDWLQSESFVDADGETYHGVQTFRFIIDQL